MAINVTTETVTDTAEPFDFGNNYNDIDVTIFVTGANSIFIGGENVDDADAGVEWAAGSEHNVTLKSGSKLYRVCSAGDSSTVKILNTGN